MIEPWTEEERIVAFAIFDKIQNNNREWLAARRAGEMPAIYPMPHDIYEAHRLTMKSVTSEIGIFDEQGRMLLTLRPSANEDPAEPYPSQWHIPGIRHIAQETNEDALQRLIDDEIGTKIEARLVECKEYPIDERNGLSLLSLLYVARASSGVININERSQWFDITRLPESILEEHRAIVALLATHISVFPEN